MIVIRPSNFAIRNIRMLLPRNATRPTFRVFARYIKLLASWFTFVVGKEISYPEANRTFQTSGQLLTDSSNGIVSVRYTLSWLSYSTSAHICLLVFFSIISNYSLLYSVHTTFGRSFSFSLIIYTLNVTSANILLS